MSRLHNKLAAVTPVRKRVSLHYGQGNFVLQAVENAIREGVIYWHAFPFNAQLELMDEPLIRSSVHMTHSLDKRFGYLPKMTLSQVCTLSFCLLSSPQSPELSALFGFIITTHFLVPKNLEARYLQQHAYTIPHSARSLHFLHQRSDTPIQCTSSLTKPSVDDIV